MFKFKLSGSCFKKASAPVTINNVKNEKIIKFNNKLKFPFFNEILCHLLVDVR